MGEKYYDGSSGSGKGGMDWIDLAQDRDRWWTVDTCVCVNEPLGSIKCAEFLD
jgi:hypothetical protein